jgi:hypothetical protein
MKSTLIEGKRESVFPVDPCPNSFSRLSITKIFGKLHHADESETPGRNRGMPFLCIDAHKKLIIIDASQFIAHLYVNTGLSEMMLVLPGRSLGESREGFFFGGSSILDPFRLFLLRPPAQELFVSSMAGPFSTIPLIVFSLCEFANR